MALKVLYSLADHEGGSLEAVLTDFWQNFQFRNDVLGEVVTLDVNELLGAVKPGSTCVPKENAGMVCSTSRRNDAVRSMPLFTPR